MQQQKVVSAPTPFYPSSDGKPMAETDWHRKLLMALLQIIEHHFRDHDDVYVSGDLLIYYKLNWRRLWQPLNVSKPKKTTKPFILVAFPRTLSMQSGIG